MLVANHRWHNNITHHNYKSWERFFIFVGQQVIKWEFYLLNIKNNWIFRIFVSVLTLINSICKPVPIWFNCRHVWLKSICVCNFPSHMKRTILKLLMQAYLTTVQKLVYAYQWAMLEYNTYIFWLVVSILNYEWSAWSWLKNKSFIA